MTSNQGVSLVRPFVLAHLAEVERGEGKRRDLPDGSQIVSGASWPKAPVVVLPDVPHAWGYSPNPVGGS